eukprot:scaffold218707_cov43-Attheya_sp.AAC.1
MQRETSGESIELVDLSWHVIILSYVVYNYERLLSLRHGDEDTSLPILEDTYYSRGQHLSTYWRQVYLWHPVTLGHPGDFD